jgi:hypothetical protein
MARSKCWYSKRAGWSHSTCRCHSTVASLLCGATSRLATSRKSASPTGKSCSPCGSSCGSPSSSHSRRATWMGPSCRVARSGASLGPGLAASWSAKRRKPRISPSTLWGSSRSSRPRLPKVRRVGLPSRRTVSQTCRYS